MSSANQFIASRSAEMVRYFGFWAGLAIAVASLLTLAGWIAQVPGLLGAEPHMKANTALALGLMGACVSLVIRRGPVAWMALLPVLGGLIGALTMAQYLTGADFGLDQLLARDFVSPQVPFPGRMTPLTALALVCAAVSLLLVHSRNRLPFAVHEAAALLAVTMGVVGVIGALYQIRFLSGLGLTPATMATLTGAMVALLGASALAIQPHRGLLQIVLTDRSGGRFARSLLPIAILFPIAIGWVRIRGEALGWFQGEFGVVMIVLSAMFVFSLIAVIGAARLNRSEEALLEAQQVLEQRVQERTNDLEATVARLRGESALREAAEASRAESQALFRSALEFAPIGMAIVGLDGRFLQVNRQLCEIVGYDEPKLLSLTFQDITHADDLNADLALVDSLVKGNIPHYQLEKRYIRKDGQPVWVMLSVSLVRDSGGAPLFFVAQIEDIEMRRRAEEQIAASRQFLSDVVNSIPIPLTVKNDQGRVVIANSAMSAFHGMPAAEIVGKTDLDLFSEERARAFRAEDQALLRTGTPLVDEQQFTTLGEELRWVIKYKHRIVLSDGSSCVLTTLLDITDRKKAEIALRESEERFRSLTALSSDWYWEQDENLRFTLQSGGALTALGIGVEQVIGKTRWEVPYSEMTEADWRRHRETLEAHQPFRDLELMRHAEDGSRRYVSISGEPMFDAEGRFRGYRGTGRDITARRRMEDELAQSRQFLSDVIDFVPVPLAVKDDSARMVMVNSAMEAFQKRSAAELVGKTDYDLFPPERARALRAEDEAVLRTGAPMAEEQKFLTVGGDLRWVIKHKQRIVPGDGRRLIIATLLDITERKEAELALERNQRFLESVIEAIPQPVFLKDSQHRWVLFNSAFCDLLGQPREAILGHSDPDIYPPDWVARVWAEDNRVLSGEDSVVVEESTDPRQDGTSRWMLKSKRRVTLPDESTYIVGVSTDITRLKRAEEALRTSEELHRLLADNSSDLISLLTTAGAIEYASPASVAILGLPPDQLIGRVVGDLIHPDDAPHALEVFGEVVKKQEPVVFTCRLLRADGRWSWIETSFRAIRDPREGLTSQVIAVSRDINERVRVTDALNHFKYVLDNTLDMIFIYDSDTLRFNYVNEGAARTLGIPRERLLGMAPWQVRTDITEKAYRRFIEPFLDGRVQSTQLDTTHRRADGSLMPVEVTMQLVRRPGEVGTFISIARDLTERRKVEQMKNEFVSTVSHELRTPVTSIRGSLGLLAGGVAGKLPKRARQLIDIAGSNSDRLIRLINDILDMEKIESGKMQFVMGPVRLRELLHRAVQENQGYAERFEVRFRLVGEIPDVVLRADRDRILQVMANLLSNAAKFSPAGAEVEIGTRAGPGSVQVSVTDHGGGIPPGFHDKIFEKFSQADASDSRTMGGSGLGLSIARAIVEKHGGEIGFRTAQGQGTTFHFELPLAIDAARQQEAAASGAAGEDGATIPAARNRVH